MSPNELKIKDFSVSLMKKFPLGNGRHCFKGDISYQWNDGANKIELFDIDIIINLNSDSFGNIDLSDGQEIFDKELISEIVINFVNTHVEINNNNTLKITGKSDDIGGFKISIYPS